MKVCRRAREPFWDIPVPKMTALGDKYAFGARTGLRPPRHPTYAGRHGYHNAATPVVGLVFCLRLGSRPDSDKTPGP